MRVPTHTPHPIHPRMPMRIFAAATTAVLAAALPARAQDADSATAPNGLRPGAWSLSFASPGSGERGELGAWRMAGPRTNLGLTLAVYVNDRDRQDEGGNEAEFQDEVTGVELGAAARRYLVLTRSVAPYVQGRLFASATSQRRDGPGFEENGSGAAAGAELAVGAEWFPVRQFSVSGHTGVRASVGRVEQDVSSPQGEGGYDATEITLGTFTSALSLRIYF